MKELEAIYNIKCKVFTTLSQFSLHLIFQILLQLYNLLWFNGFSVAPTFYTLKYYRLNTS